MTDLPDPLHDVEITDSIPRGLAVTSDRPYRILMIADFAGGESGELAGELRDGVVELTSGGADEALAAAAPTLQLPQPEKQAGPNAPPVSLRFQSLRDFTAPSLVERIPLTKSLVKLRHTLTDRLHGKTSPDALAATLRGAAGDPAMTWVQVFFDKQTAPPVKAAAPDAVQALLGSLELAESADGPTPAPAPAGPPRSDVSKAVAAAAGGPVIAPEESSRIRQTVAEIDRRLNEFLNTVMHAPAFKSAESAWRSLAFLVSHADHRQGLRISILHAQRSELEDRFVSRTIDPIFDGAAPAPELIVAAYPFGSGAPDIDLLDTLAQHAASLPAVVLAESAAGFFGVQNAWQVPTLPPLTGLFDQWQYAKWRSLRGKAYATSLGLVFGKCLLRAPYARDDNRDLEYCFHEDFAAERDGLWASGVIAAAAAAARSVVETRWPTALAGVIQGRIEGFATATGGKDGKKRYGPADTQMPPPRLPEFAGAGVNIVSTLADDTGVIFWNGLTALHVGKVSQEGLLEVSLAYRLFAVRISGLLFELKKHLGGLSADQVRASASAHLRDWLGLTAEQFDELAQVQARPAGADAATVELAIRLVPPETILPGGVPVVLGYRIP